MQKLFILCALAVSLPMAALAQHDGEPSGRLPADSTSSWRGNPLPVPDSVACAGFQPFFPIAAPGMEGCAPWAVPYGGTWRLHEGFNAQFSLGVSAAFGKHAPHGAGFNQSAAFVYAVPLTQRLSVAAGVYAGNMDWGAFHQTEAGLTALLAYRVNPAVSLYAYASKGFFPRRDTRPGGYFPMFYPPAGDRFGAMAEFKLGRNAAIQVSVECRE